MSDGVPSVERARDFEVLREVASYQGVAIPPSADFMSIAECYARWGKGATVLYADVCAYSAQPWGLATWPRV